MSNFNFSELIQTQCLDCKIFPITGSGILAQDLMLYTSPTSFFSEATRLEHTQLHDYGVSSAKGAEDCVA